MEISDFLPFRSPKNTGEGWEGVNFVEAAPPGAKAVFGSWINPVNRCQSAITIDRLLVIFVNCRRLLSIFLTTTLTTISFSALMLVYLFVFVCKLLCLQTAFTFLFSFFTACVDNNPDCAGYIYENGGPQEYCNDPAPYIQDYVKLHCRKTCNIDNCK